MRRQLRCDPLCGAFPGGALTAADEHADVPVPGWDGEAPDRPMRILLVEYVRRDAEMVMAELRLVDWQAFDFSVVHDLATALARIDEGQVDAVLLDLTLPDSKGLSTLMRVHERAPELPIVVLSGLEDARTADTAMQTGAQEYVSKKHLDGVVLARAVRYAVDLKNTAAKLANANESFRALTEETPDLISRVDHDLRLVYVNPAMAREVDDEDPAITARSLRSMGCTDESIAIWRHHLASVARTGDGELFEFEAHADGASRWFQARLVREAVPGSNAPPHVLTVLRETTALKHIEARLADAAQDLEARVDARTTQLERAIHELEAFSQAVSHDLRAPLRRIDFLAEAMEEDYRDRMPPEVGAHLERIRNEAKRTSSLVSGLLDLSRARRTPLRRESVDISILARAVVQSLSEHHHLRRVQCTIEETPCVTGDSALLRIVLQNLLDNAWKYTSKVVDAQVAFGTAPLPNESAVGGERVFFVRDNGAGFDMSEAPKLFHAFERLASTGSFSGTGIGLATVARIVERHNGRVWAEGRPGLGATFYFALPDAAQNT